MVEVQIKYEGQLHCRATHGPSGCVISTDAPVDNHGKGESFSPTDLVATALGSCIATIMAISAEKRGIDLRGTTITVEKHMSTDAPRRISRLPVLIEVPIEIEEDKRKAIENAARHCPVHQSLADSVDAPMEFRYSSGDN